MQFWVKWLVLRFPAVPAPFFVLNLALHVQVHTSILTMFVFAALQAGKP